jgi:hypothetical protein
MMKVGRKYNLRNQWICPFPQTIGHRKVNSLPFWPLLRQTVYYIEDEAKLLDTFAIMRNSGKGCDASNLYDEEVLNVNDLYFSDDEEERQFKSNKKE